MLPVTMPPATMLPVTMPPVARGVRRCSPAQCCSTVPW
jgi:hypothetical protein